MPMRQAVNIDQCTAAATRVNRGIGLNVYRGQIGITWSGYGTDDSHRY